MPRYPSGTASYRAHPRYPRSTKTSRAPLRDLGSSRTKSKTIRPENSSGRYLDMTRCRMLGYINGQTSHCFLLRLFSLVVVIVLRCPEPFVTASNPGQPKLIFRTCLHPGLAKSGHATRIAPQSNTSSALCFLFLRNTTNTASP